MKYAIIKSGGKQYRVNEGDELLIDKLSIKEGENYLFPEILFVKDNEKLEIGRPYLKNAKVLGKVIKQLLKGEKITIAKFKAKVHYRKKMGFRPLYTKIRIESISIETKEAGDGEKKMAAKKTRKITSK
uniref:Large ribosomal subunit protein bL21 n=1 Tax=candidate division CPR3 bacterium TaxID=2268181 RepID=A0A7C4R8E7_UNCC3